jgi:hypothetical protein
MSLKSNDINKTLNGGFFGGSSLAKSSRDFGETFKSSLSSTNRSGKSITFI